MTKAGRRDARAGRNVGTEATRQSVASKVTFLCVLDQKSVQVRHKLGRGRSSTLRLSSVFRFRRRRCLSLHVAGSVGSAALQRLYVVDNVPRTSACVLTRGGTWMLLLETVGCSPRTLDVPVLVPHARCAATGGVHGAVPLWHQGQAPEPTLTLSAFRR